MTIYADLVDTKNIVPYYIHRENIPLAYFYQNKCEFKSDTVLEGKVMFSKYFEELQKKIEKSTTSTAKGSGERKKKGKGKHADLIALMNNLIPVHLKLDDVKIIDSSGYSPEGVDFVVYQEIFRDLSGIMGGFVPAEVVYGTFHVCDNLDAKALGSVLNGVSQAKKMNRFSQEVQEELVVPSFIIAYKTGMGLADLKNRIVNFYVSKSIEHVNEFDIMMILGFGLLIKDWKEKRKFIALETGKDTLKWFFMLMNEYLEVERGQDLDFRNYVIRQERYNEY